MALTEIQLKICRFHGSLSQKGSRPLLYSISNKVIQLLHTEFLEKQEMPYFHVTHWEI